MREELLRRFFEEKIKIQIVLKNKRYFTGTIVKLDNDCLIFCDKFNNEIPIDLNSIAYVDYALRGRENG